MQFKNKTSTSHDIVKECIKNGYILNEELDKALESFLSENTKTFKSNLNKLDSLDAQWLNSEFDLHYETERDKWLKSVDKKLSQIVDYEWSKIFSNHYFIEEYIDDLYKFLDSLPPSTSRKNTFQGLIIDTKRWILINNKTLKEKKINQTQVHFLLEVLLKYQNQIITWSTILPLLQNEPYNMKRISSKECHDLKSKFLEQLRELGISEKICKKIITTKNGFALNTKVFKVI